MYIEDRSLQDVLDSQLRPEQWNGNVRIANQALGCFAEACIHLLSLWDPKVKVFLKSGTCPEHTYSLNSTL